jgi:MFS family permease
VFFGEQIFNDSLLATVLINSVAAFIGGALCDIKGRKVAGILGFVLLGLGYAFLSFLSGGTTKELSLYLYIICDGLAWGILFVTFIFILWGDLSEEKIREKFYFVGSLPFLFSGMIQMLIQPLVQNIESLSTTFSLASFFLFLAIVPLLFASETLPEKAMKDRDLKSYLEKAQKVATKDGDKKKKKGSKPKEEEEPKEEEKSEEYDEARKLAEKYY